MTLFSFFSPEDENGKAGKKGDLTAVMSWKYNLLVKAE